MMIILVNYLKLAGATIRNNLMQVALTLDVYIVTHADSIIIAQLFTHPVPQL